MKHCAAELRLAGALLAGALLTAGCSELRQTLALRSGGSKKAQMTEPQLRTALDDFESRVSYMVAETAEQIREQTRSNIICQRSLRWQMETILSLRDVVRRPDAVQAFLQAWILCERMRQAVESGFYKDTLGEFQPTVIETCQRAVVEIEDLGRQLLTPSEFQVSQRDVVDFAKENPIAGTYSGPLLHEIGFGTTAGQRFEEILDVPLSPFNPLKGVDRTAQAISDFTLVAGRFADIVEDWPQTLSWQAQLLALNLSDNDTVESLENSAAQLGDSAQRLAASSENLVCVAQELPAQVGDELAAREQTISAVLRELSDTTARLEQFLKQMQATSGTIEATARSTTEAGQAWVGTVHAIRDLVAYFVSLGSGPDRGPSGEAAAKPAARPQVAADGTVAAPAARGAGVEPRVTAGADQGHGYDILDYEKTAVALTAAAQELRALTTEVRELTGSSAWTQRLAEVEAQLSAAVAQAARRADGVTDHAAWRGAQLIVLMFALWLAIRWVGSRLRGASPPAG